MPVRPTLLNRMALVSFRQFCKNLGNLQEFFGQMVYRPPWQKIARTPMPLNHVEFFRKFFEEAGMSLSSSCNIHQLIPFILEEEYKSLEKELKGKDVGTIFDGTTREGEALVVLVRFVHEWEVKSRLVRFQITQSSVNRDELVRIIIEVLHRKLDVPQSQLLAAMRDRALVNTKTIGKVSILYPGMPYFLLSQSSGC